MPPNTPPAIGDGSVAVSRENIVRIIVRITKAGVQYTFNSYIKKCCAEDTETLLHLSVYGGYDAIGMKKVKSFSSSRDYILINKFDGGRTTTNVKSNSIRLFEMEVDYKKDAIPFYESLFASGNFVHRRDVKTKDGYDPVYQKFIVATGEILHNQVDDTTIVQISGYYAEQIINQGEE